MTTSISDIYSRGNQSASGESEAVKKLKEIQAEAGERTLWASAQASALAKVKLFHTMAKAINDQQ